MGEMVETDSQAGEDTLHQDLLAPGVYGWRFDTPEEIYIPVITAAKPGSGDVARFLDGLPKDRRIVFACVLSQRLRDMLLRRGFVDGAEWSEQHGEHVDVMVR